MRHVMYVLFWLCEQPKSLYNFVPKREYIGLLLMRCEWLVDMEFEERFSEKFIMEVKESKEAYNKGEFVKVEGSKERKKLFESL